MCVWLLIVLSAGLCRVLNGVDSSPSVNNSQLQLTALSNKAKTDSYHSVCVCVLEYCAPQDV